MLELDPGSVHDAQPNGRARWGQARLDGWTHDFAPRSTSLSWYDDVFTLHGIPTRPDRGSGRHSGRHPLAPAAKTVHPEVEAAQVLIATDAFEQCSVADLFGDLGLDRHGFELLFEAAWFHGPPVDGPGPLPAGWSVVSTAPDLAAWSEAHDYTGVLVPGVLDNPRFRILARHRDGALVGGAVTHRGADVVDLSNVWGDDDLPVRRGARGRPGVASRASRHGLRGRSGLEEMLTLGFTAVGPRRVWVR